MHRAGPFAGAGRRLHRLLSGGKRAMVMMGVAVSSGFFITRRIGEKFLAAGFAAKIIARAAMLGAQRIGAQRHRHSADWIDGARLAWHEAHKFNVPYIYLYGVSMDTTRGYMGGAGAACARPAKPGTFMNDNPQRHHVNFALMAALSFVSMYALMYAMTAPMSGAIAGFDRFYMTGVMTVPMVLFEITLMWAVHANRKIVAVLIALAAVALAALLTSLDHHIMFGR
jgi:hypothetical protein